MTTTSQITLEQLALETGTHHQDLLADAVAGILPATFVDGAWLVDRLEVRDYVADLKGDDESEDDDLDDESEDDDLDDDGENDDDDGDFDESEDDE